MSNSKLYRIISTTSVISGESLEHAVEIFYEYQAKGVIRSDCQFDDPVWYLTDEYQKAGLHFDFSRGTYDKYYKSIFGMGLDEFIDHVKAFICILLGNNCISCMNSLLLDARRLTRTPAPSLYEHYQDIKFNLPKLIFDFLTLLPENDELNDFLEAFEVYKNAAYGHGNQRELADFDSYFKFDRILDSYWKSNISDWERDFFFPLYLWWKLTAVIPTRPREILLTPRDCLFQKDGGYYLRLRKNMLKGRSKDKKHSYTIEGDYATIPLHITDELAFEIKNYINRTSDYEATDLDTLFIANPHYKFFGQKKHKNSRFLTYMNMNTILKKFYTIVVEEIFGYDVVYDKDPDKELSPNEIAYIHLGDTRHISMINLVVEGSPAVAAMILAGHSSITTSEHYFTNIRQYIKCKAYNEYVRINQKDIAMIITPNRSARMDITDGIPLKSGGVCYSPSYEDKTYEDCIKAVGPNGELAFHKRCPYFRSEHGESFHIDDSVYLRNLKDDCKEIERAVRTVRKKMATVDEIEQAVMKLQASANTYKDFSKEVVIKEAADGKTSDDK